MSTWGSSLQACAFTGGTCPESLRGCGGVCVINEARVATGAPAEDRSFGDDWWSMCPRVAQVVRALQRTRRRHLLDAGFQVPIDDHGWAITLIFWGRHLENR